MELNFAIISIVTLGYSVTIIIIPVVIFTVITPYVFTNILEELAACT
jgi:hypothetical protein